MNQKEFDQFIKKVAQNTHSASEMERFHAWLRALPKEQAEIALDRYEEVFSTDEPTNVEAYRRIEEGIEQQLNNDAPRSAKITRLPTFFYLKIAAAVVAVFSISFFLYKQAVQHDDTTRRLASLPIVPGKNQAILKLGDGQSILLEDMADGLIKMDNEVTGFQKKKGLLVATGEEVIPQYIDNVLETPKGGQYQLLLPDGSKVWLNASSRLFFPAAFKPGERKVKLLGEAYFEVAANAANPFIVETTRGTLRVLGTSFNVSAYQDDAREITTLLNGSLKVAHGQSQVLLKPGQQAVLNVKGGVAVQDVETSYAVAWKEGYFMFNRETIKEVMDKIARWYDVDVAYQGPVTETRFWGTVSKFAQVADVLKMLEATEGVHFVIKGRRIYVKK